MERLVDRSIDRLICPPKSVSIAEQTLVDTSLLLAPKLQASPTAAALASFGGSKRFGIVVSAAGPPPGRRRREAGSDQMRRTPPSPGMIRFALHT